MLKKEESCLYCNVLRNLGGFLVKLEYYITDNTIVKEDTWHGFCTYKGVMCIKHKLYLPKSRYYTALQYH